MNFRYFQKSGYLILVTIFMMTIYCDVSADGGYDLRFLNEQPYRKGKQRVDLSEVNNEHELTVIREAINPIMQFFYSLSYIQFRPDILELRTTERGRQLLRYPPLDTNTNRYAFTKLWKWHVIDEHTLEVSAEFKNLLRDKASYNDHFVFIKVDKQWKFDHHE